MMHNIGNKAAELANKVLSVEQESMLVATAINVEALTPLTQNQNELEALRSAVSQATESNENCAQLITRLEGVAEVSEEVVSKVISVIKTVV
jgi:hypothetical protein